MNNSKHVDWIIHYVNNNFCDCCGVQEQSPISFPAFANIHTHGLDRYNHKELCIPLELDSDIACQILNQCGLKIKYDNMKYVQGKQEGVIQGFPVLFYELPNSNTLYMILPDPNGKFPDDEGCEFPYNKQLIYSQIIEEDK